MTNVDQAIGILRDLINHEHGQDLPFSDEGKIEGTPYRLNIYLARHRFLTPEAIEALKVSHQVKHMLFEAARGWQESPKVLRMLAAQVEALEFEQQALWGFERDSSFHRFFDFPGCSCPKLDNEERIGIKNARIISHRCKVHGR